MKILSPVASSCGAYVLHKSLEAGIEGYHVRAYPPPLEYFPLAFPFLFRHEYPDIIHTTPDYGIFFQRRNLPLIVTVHHIVLDSYMQAYSNFSQRIHYKTDLRWFTCMSLKRADIVTSVSQSTARMVREELGYKKDIRVIYNGIDCKRFYPCKGLTTSNKKKIRVLFAGNLTLRKGANWLPEIAKHLRPGIDICFTRGLRKEVPLPSRSNLTDLGYVSFVDMPSLYQNADILLFPSVREGFGLVVAEAMACGLPVVATNCSSLPELIVDGQGGYLCKVGDVQDFSRKINLLAENPELRKSMGQFNCSRVEELFSKERMIGEYKLLFEETKDCFGRG